LSNPAPKTVFVVDPEEDFLEWADKHLRTPETDIRTFSDSQKALDAFLEEPADLVIVELYTPPLGGMQLLKKLRLNAPNSMVVLTTGFPPSSAVIEAMKLGAYDVLRKETLPHDLRPVVDDALKAGDEIKATPAPLEEAKSKTLAPSDEIIGESAAMQGVFKLVGRAARGDAPVLITGESGAGKEVVAGAIHRFSRRAGSEYVALNCAAIPENLLESELFGHEKGAFTGATAQRKGRFEQCDGGTLFLDEIGDMPLQTQSKILRALQSGEFARVGGNDTLRADVRVLAATNKDLEAAVRDGSFREDLFYRLNVVRVHIPPLRQRREDVRPLANFFLERIASKKNGPPLRLSEDAIALLESHSWPGNVRELENTLHRASVLGTADVLLPKDIPLGSVDLRPDSSPSVATAIETLKAAAGDRPLIPFIESLLEPE
jgi:DNA-binding NtrC family response regulator